MPTLLCRAITLTLFAPLPALALAEYKCAEPPGPLERRACAAAQKGPAALRHFIQRTRPLEALYFFDYMTEAELLAWRARTVAPTVGARRSPKRAQRGHEEQPVIDDTQVSGAASRPCL